MTVLDALERTFVQKLFDRRNNIFYEGVPCVGATLSQ